MGEEVGSTGLSCFGGREEEAELLRSTELFEAESGELRRRKMEKLKRGGSEDESVYR